MEQYSNVSYELSALLTKRYSTSFGTSVTLLEKSLRPHIAAIYGLVRIADEIVDSYRGNDKSAQLDALEAEVFIAIKKGYSTNPLVHSFAITAAAYNIDASLITPFFASMRTDITAKTFTQKEYVAYIHGSAEVVGLMCLKVFLKGDKKQYKKLAPGATALGSAYQKVNFLRDIKADHDELGRCYFPGITFKSFSEADKRAIIVDIAKDLEKADSAIKQLPSSVRKAVRLSYRYYLELLEKLALTDASILKQRRIRVNDSRKLLLYVRTLLGANT